MRILAGRTLGSAAVVLALVIGGDVAGSATILGPTTIASPGTMTVIIEALSVSSAAESGQVVFFLLPSIAFVVSTSPVILTKMTMIFKAGESLLLVAIQLAL